MRRRDGPRLDVRLPLAFPGEWFGSIDQVRGAMSRAEFIREAVQRRLRRLGHPVKAPLIVPGHYDRMEFGLVTNPKTLRRKRQNAWRREYRARRGKRVRQAPEISFTFMDCGIVQADDLAGLTDAGFIDDHGRYERFARHDEEVVRAALLAQMQADPARKWPARLAQFAEATLTG